MLRQNSRHRVMPEWEERKIRQKRSRTHTNQHARVCEKEKWSVQQMHARRQHFWQHICLDHLLQQYRFPDHFLQQHMCLEHLLQQRMCLNDVLCAKKIQSSSQTNHRCLDVYRVCIAHDSRFPSQSCCVHNYHLFAPAISWGAVNWCNDIRISGGTIPLK